METHRGPKHRDRVDLDDADEVRWWCKVLGVTEEELRQTVRHFGADAVQVRKHLTK